MTFSTSPSPFNRLIQEPGLSDILNEVERRIFLELNCHAVATIISFNPSDQTVKARISYNKEFLQQQTDGTFKQVEQQYSAHVQCPIVSLYGGDSGLTFPIKAGDYGLMFFNDRDFDIWFNSGQQTAPNSSRAHNLSDAFILVGLRNMQTKLGNYDNVRAKLFNKNTQVAVNDGHVLIDNGTENLKTLLQNLVSKVTDLVNATAVITVVAPPGGGTTSRPANAATITAIATQLSTISTQIGNLLE